MFNENSIVVRTWYGAVMSDVYPFEMVPNLSNLRDEVVKKLKKSGFDVDAA